MDGAMRAAYLCVNPNCKAWRWVDPAKERGEKTCKKCGTSFNVNSIKAYPTFADGGKGKGKGKNKGGGDAHQLQEGKGGTGPKSVGLQSRNHLRGGGKGGGLASQRVLAP